VFARFVHQKSHQRRAALIDALRVIDREHQGSRGAGGEYEVHQRALRTCLRIGVLAALRGILFD
jgi:hypothetical protein